MKGYTSMHFQIDGKEYWNIDTNFLYKRFYCKKTLPSDSLNRPDLLNLMNDDIEKSQEAKELLEGIQRNDRALRKKYYKEP